MATIEPYETKQGRRYRVRYRTPDRRQTDKRGFKTKREAELHLASVEVSKARGEYVDVSASRARVETLGANWLATQTHLKPSASRSIEIAWRVHVEPRWGRVSVADVQHSEVQRWVSELSKSRSATTVIRAYGVLAAILDVAIRDRRLAANPARGVKLPRKQKRAHIYLSAEEVAKLAEQVGDQKLFILTLSYCGLRWGEATALRRCDIDLARRRLEVRLNAVEVGSEIVIGTPKSHEQRSVPFPPSLAELFATACDGKAANDLVFTGSKGQRLLRPKTDAGWFGTSVKRAGLARMTPHDLRHTAASLAVSAGANVKAVQRMLGHASATMTLDVYADLFEDDLDEVALRLDERLLASGAAALA
ncbi:site-specific integrase [Schumannella sp. 10F1B-5-1]|uniref:site-specific integrase n=1 Tax=Schumannella sp. 10F1B-5-1 TaxID=2590780 RepID=UPI001131DDBC|nr:site-specific integrase [Schumannella sp. 10F1B-5-1]TPW78412.1 site-specific integrase [Schumannella sp. 10F1B-5-1]